MLTPSEVFQGARNLHPAFHAQRHPDLVLGDVLEAWQDDILSKIQRVHSDELRLTEVVDLPLGDFDAGYAFPANEGAYPGLVYWNETEFPRSTFSLEPEAHAADPQAWPSGYFRGSTLHLHARAEDWTRFDRIEIPYAPDSDGVDLEANTTSLPDAAAQAARYYLAEVMAARHPGGEPVPPLDYFMTKAERAQDDLVRRMQLKGSAQVGKVRDVVRRRR